MPEPSTILIPIKLCSSEQMHRMKTRKVNKRPPTRSDCYIRESRRCWRRCGTARSPGCQQSSEVHSVPPAARWSLNAPSAESDTWTTTTTLYVSTTQYTIHSHSAQR